MSIVPGRDVPAVPDEWVEAVNARINDENHEDLCMCDGWPDACASGYKPGLWDIGVDLHIAIGVLEPLIRDRIADEEPCSRRIDQKYRAGVEEHASSEAIEAELAKARRELRTQQRYVAWNEALLERRLAQKAAGTWPPKTEERNA